MKRMLMTVLSVAAIAAFAKTPELCEKRVLFLGDSITDKCHVGCTKNYWGFGEGHRPLCRRGDPSERRRRLAVRFLESSVKVVRMW